MVAKPPQGGGQSRPVSNSPIVLSLSPLSHRCMILTLNHHLSGPIVSLTSRSNCCSHHQRCGTAPLLCLPCLHSIRNGRFAAYTTIVCRQTMMLTYTDTRICRGVHKCYAGDELKQRPGWISTVHYVSAKYLYPVELPPGTCYVISFYNETDSGWK